MYNFENKGCNNGEGVLYSRLIASWIKANGLRHYLFDENFTDWLKSAGLPEEEVNEIRLMAENGKLEAEVSASMYMKKNGIKTVLELISKKERP